jgi:hypothetical protein
MTRRVRNPGTGKPPHNGPAKGPGAGPARGAGWGGRPRGEGKHAAATHRFGPEDTEKSLAVRAQPAVGVNPLTGRGLYSVRALEKAQLEEELQSMLLDITRDENEPTPNRIVAADKLLDRISGKPRMAPEDASKQKSLLDLVRESMTIEKNEG